MCVFVFKINFDYRKLFRASRFRQDFRVEKINLKSDVEKVSFS